MKTLFQLFKGTVLGFVLLVPSLSPAQNYPDAVSQKVQAAQKQVKVIGMEEYRKIVDDPGDALIVDVREPNEYAAGHVPGAINIPRGVLEFKIWKHLESPTGGGTDKPVVLQCQSGNRASLAAQSLAELGFTHSTAVVMSLDEWQKEGHPFTK